MPMDQLATRADRYDKGLLLSAIQECDMKWQIPDLRTHWVRNGWFHNVLEDVFQEATFPVSVEAS